MASASQPAIGGRCLILISQAFRWAFARLLFPQRAHRSTLRKVARSYNPTREDGTDVARHAVGDRGANARGLPPDEAGGEAAASRRAQSRGRSDGRRPRCRADAAGRRTGGVTAQRYQKITDMLEIIPSVRLTNYVFRNRGDLTFEAMPQGWGIKEPSFSNGSANLSCRSNSFPVHNFVLHQ